jgi:hypothetical protein
MNLIFYPNFGRHPVFVLDQLIKANISAELYGDMRAIPTNFYELTLEVLTDWRGPMLDIRPFINEAWFCE